MKSNDFFRGLATGMETYLTLAYKMREYNLQKEQLEISRENLTLRDREIGIANKQIPIMQQNANTSERNAAVAERAENRQAAMEPYDSFESIARRNYYSSLARGNDLDTEANRFKLNNGIKVLGLKDDLSGLLAQGKNAKSPEDIKVFNDKIGLIKKQLAVYGESVLPTSQFEVMTMTDIVNFVQLASLGTPEDRKKISDIMDNSGSDPLAALSEIVKNNSFPQELRDSAKGVRDTLDKTMQYLGEHIQERYDNEEINPTPPAVVGEDGKLVKVDDEALRVDNNRKHLRRDEVSLEEMRKKGLAPNLDTELFEMFMYNYMSPEWIQNYNKSRIYDMYGKTRGFSTSREGQTMRQGGKDYPIRPGKLWRSMAGD